VTAAGLAVAAGILAAFNPCGFALLPAWAAYHLGHAGQGELLGRLLAALRLGGLATSAFLVVFGVAGLLLSAGLAVLGAWLPWAGLLIGLTLAGFGALLLGRGHAPGLRIGRGYAVRPGSDARAGFGFGIAYAMTSLSCVLPVFLLTVGIAAGQPAAARLVGFAGFAVGMGLVLSLVAIAAALLRPPLANARRAARFIPRLSGVVVLGTAVVIVQRELGLAALALDRPPPATLASGGVAILAVAIVAGLTLTTVRGRRDRQASAPRRLV
jgi:cytochrome c biogenesis protein CcdA